MENPMEVLKSPYGHLWVKGDLDGFFGLFTNVLTNVLVLSGLLQFAIGMPASIVYGRIVPAVGVSTIFGNLYYAYAAKRKATEEERDDVTALAYGVSVPHMFLVTFVVVGPIYAQTGNATLAWYAGMAWAFIEGIIEISGAAVGKTVRKYTPRAGILGTLAGVSIAFIALRPLWQTWGLPYIGLVSFTIIMVGWLGNKKFPLNAPAGAVAIIIGTIIAWSTGVMSYPELVNTAAQFSIYPPIPEVTGIIQGFSEIIPYLATAIPMGIYNFFETMSNVESAAAAGDEYSTRNAMLVDGLGSTIGAVFGSIFPTAVYIGHPGWKKLGARIGYSVATGIGIFLVCVLGVAPILLKIIPIEALIPILLYIGLVIGAQAFQKVPKKHAPAVVLALLPHFADWAVTKIDSALNLAGTSASEIGFQALRGASVFYESMRTVGRGAIVVGLILGGMLAFIIDDKLDKAAIYAGIAAVLTYVGFIHAAKLQLGSNIELTIGYAAMVLVLLIMYKFDIGKIGAFTKDEEEEEKVES